MRLSETWVKFPVLKRDREKARQSERFGWRRREIVWLILVRKGKYGVRGLILIKGKMVEKRWEREAKPHFVVVCHGERITRIRMIGIKEMFGLSLIPLLVIVSMTSGEEGVQDLFDRSYGEVPFDRRLQYLLETKRSVNGVKNFLDELQNLLEKRTACAMDGGMSASCNHKDAVEAGEHHRFLASSFAPGRRKRGSLHALTRNFRLRN